MAQPTVVVCLQQEKGVRLVEPREVQKVRVLSFKREGQRCIGR